MSIFLGVVVVPVINKLSYYMIRFWQWLQKSEIAFSAKRLFSIFIHFLGVFRVYLF